MKKNLLLLVVAIFGLGELRGSEKRLNSLDKRGESATGIKKYDGEKAEKKKQQKKQKEKEEQDEKARNDAKTTISNWFKSIIGWSPALSSVKNATLKGKRNLDLLNAKIQLSPLARFNAGVNFITQNFYENDLRNAINKLEKELIQLLNSEEAGIEESFGYEYHNNEKYQKTGGAKYAILVRATEALITTIKDTDLKLDELAKKQNESSANIRNVKRESQTGQRGLRIPGGANEQQTKLLSN